MSATDERSSSRRPAEPGRGQGAEWARTLAICAAAGIFMALIGAFASDAEPLGRRLVYWVGLLLAGGLIGEAISRPIFGSARLGARPWLACLLVAALLTLPLTVIVWAASTLFFRTPWDPIEMFYTLPSVALVSVVMTTILYLSDHRPRETHSAAAGSAPPRFLDRLPAKLKGAEIYAVEAEDHYLRVHTERGSDLILMRLSDALAELEGIEGAQTHRSWWVAKEAVVGVERGDGRATFALKSGARAPVSRTYARVLRREGWY